MAFIEDRREKGKGWRVRYRDPTGRERSRSFKKKPDAERFRDTVAADVVRGDYLDPSEGRRLFGDWADEWLATTVHLKPQTVAGYESILKCHVRPFFGDRTIGAIRQSDVRQFVSTLVSNGAGAGTVKNALNVASAIFETAVAGGAMRANPRRGVKLPRPERDEMHFLEPEQVNALAGAIQEPYGTLVRFAAYTGLRAGEITALRVGRLDLLRGSVDVVESFAEVHGKLTLGPTKTYARRTVPLPRFLRDELGAYLADRETAPESFVFSGPDGGPLRHSNFYRRQFQPAVIAALPEQFHPKDDDNPDRQGLRFHDLRHTAAALLIAQGAHPRAIMEWLGHSSVTVSMDRYGHLFPALVEALTDGLDEAYRQAVSEKLAAPPRPQGEIRALRETADDAKTAV